MMKNENVGPASVWALFEKIGLLTVSFPVIKMVCFTPANITRSKECMESILLLCFRVLRSYCLERKWSTIKQR